MYEKIFLGNTKFTKDQVLNIVKELSKEFTAESYSLMNRNCYTFTEVLCMKLLGIEIPMKYQNLLARLVNRFMTNNGITLDMTAFLRVMKIFF